MHREARSIPLTIAVDHGGTIKAWTVLEFVLLQLRAIPTIPYEIRAQIFGGSPTT